MKVVNFWLHTTLGLCAGVALEFRPPEQMPGFLLKVNIKNQCLAMLVKPELKLGYAELMLATTSSRPCKKHILLCTKVSKGTLHFHY